MQTEVTLQLYLENEISYLHGSLLDQINLHRGEFYKLINNTYIGVKQFLAFSYLGTLKWLWHL